VDLRGKVSISSIAVLVTEHGGIAEGDSVVPVVRRSAKPMEQVVTRIAVASHGALFLLESGGWHHEQFVHKTVEAYGGIKIGDTVGSRFNNKSHGVQTVRYIVDNGLFFLSDGGWYSRRDLRRRVTPSSPQ
jgi:hypothetical protein